MSEWRQIPGFGRFEAHPSGRVRRASYAPGTKNTSRPLPYEMRLVPRMKGYLWVFVQNGDGEQKPQPLHRLIALTFLGPSTDDAPLVCHRDGNKLNNSVENLYWGTYQTNADDAVRHGAYAGRRAPEKSCKLNEAAASEVKRRLRQGDRTVDIAKDYGVRSNTISMIANGSNWKHVP